MEKEDGQKEQVPEQILLKLKPSIATRIDKHWKKYKPKYSSKTHFFIVAATNQMESDIHGKTP